MTREEAIKRLKEMPRKKRDYREKDVDGIMFDGLHIKPSRITVRMTSDKYGQSLSLTAWNVQLQIPLDAVSDIIKVVEKG